MWEELVGKVGHRDQLVIHHRRLSENALCLHPETILGVLQS